MLNQLSTPILKIHNLQVSRCVKRSSLYAWMQPCVYTGEDVVQREDVDSAAFSAELCNRNTLLVISCSFQLSRAVVCGLHFLSGIVTTCTRREHNCRYLFHLTTNCCK